MNEGKLYQRTLNIYLSLPESSEDEFRRLVEATDGAWESELEAKMQQTLNSTIRETDKYIQLLLFFASGMSERGYKSICKLELVLSAEEEAEDV